MKKYTLQISNILFLVLTSIISGIYLSASAPPLRTQMSLNGKWDFTYGDSRKISIAVPGAWDQDSRVGRDIHEADYIKILSVPASWMTDNKRVKVDFEGVQHVADVFVDNKLVVNHVGGWIHFQLTLPIL